MIHYHGTRRPVAAATLTESGELCWQLEHHTDRTQAHAGADLGPDGELQWEIKRMERWQMELFRIRYKGDLAEQWMYLTAFQKGMDWHREVA